MDLLAGIKKIVEENHLDYCGIAPVERFGDFPHRHRPEDYLPGARSVIVIGMKLGLGVQLANKLAHRHPATLRHSIHSYLWHGLGLPNLFFLDTAAVLVCRLIEKASRDHTAVPIASFSPFDLRDSLSEFSNQKAAVAAGLGELGWNGFVLTPDAGPRAKFTSIITNAVLPYDAFYQGPPLCNPEKCGHSCARVCPVSALKTEGEETAVAGRPFVQGKFDKWRCLWCSLGLTKDSLCLLENPPPIPENLTLADVFKALRRGDPGQASEVMVIRRADYCGKCIMECPTGSSSTVDRIMNAEK